MSESTLDTFALEQAKSKIDALKQNVRNVLIGQDKVVEEVIIALIAGGHVLLEGVPGLGKTLLVRALANSLGMKQSRVQFTPDLMPADVTGHSMLDMASGKFTVRKGPAFTNLLLADEINRAPAKTQAALLEVMQERQITIDGDSLTLDDPFMVLATQNPIDNEGTYPLPEAQMDRFMFKVLVGYPQPEDEVNLTLLNTQARTPEQSNDRINDVQAMMQREDVLQLKQLAAQITLDAKIAEYAVNLVRSSREWPGITHGAGIRGSISLVQAAKVKAMFDGMGFVTPDHIKEVAMPVLRHRIILSAEREIAGETSESVLRQILEQVAVPRQ